MRASSSFATLCDSHKVSRQWPWACARRGTCFMHTSALRLPDVSSSKCPGNGCVGVGPTVSGPAPGNECTALACRLPSLPALCAPAACGCAATTDPFAFTPAQQFGMAAGVLFIVGSLNMAKVKTLGQLLAASTVYQVGTPTPRSPCVPCREPRGPAVGLRQPTSDPTHLLVWSHKVSLPPPLRALCPRPGGATPPREPARDGRWARHKGHGRCPGHREEGVSGGSLSSCACRVPCQILLGLFFMIGVPIIAPTTQSASFVFANYESNWVGAAPSAVSTVRVECAPVSALGWR